MKFSDLFSFEKLVAPTVIKIVYWLGILVIVLAGLGAIFSGGMYYGSIFGPLIAILGTLLSLLAWRIVCELYIVFFGAFDRLGQIRDSLQRQP